jgi:hypothetical protein
VIEVKVGIGLLPRGVGGRPSGWAFTVSATCMQVILEQAGQFYAEEVKRVLGKAAERAKVAFFLFFLSVTICAASLSLYPLLQLSVRPNSIPSLSMHSHKPAHGSS